MTYFDHDYEKFPELTNAQIRDIGFSSPHKQIVEDFDCEIVKVRDGDTFTVRTGFRDFDFAVRLAGVDSRELGEGGEEAKQFVKEWIEGKKVKCLINPKNRVGKYGRLIANVVASGLSVSEVLLQKNLATPIEFKSEGKLPTLGKDLNIRKWL